MNDEHVTNILRIDPVRGCDFPSCGTRGRKAILSLFGADAALSSTVPMFATRELL